MKIVKLNKISYQSPTAEIKVTPNTVKQNQKIKIEGKGFTSFYKRGNPGIAILFDGRPLTGVKLKSNGKFKIKMKMPPFTVGKHTIDAFGVQTEVVVELDEAIVTQDELKTIVERDFKVDPNAHLLFSDVKYRACPREELKCYLQKSDVPYKKYVAEWFDCFTPDTPVICRRDDTATLIEIEGLRDGDYILDHNNNWTKFNWKIPKQSIKPLVQLVDNDGVVELTEDHKLKVNGKYEIIGDMDKHANFDKIEYTHFSEQSLNKDLAWLYGFFCADGHSNAQLSHWNIHNQNVEYLTKAQNIIAKQFPEAEFGLNLYDCFRAGSPKNLGILKENLYMLKVLNANYGFIRNVIAAEFDKLFYSETRKKKVPTIILNADKAAREAFLDGYMAGDGAANQYAQCDSKILATGLAIVCRDIPHSIRTYAKTHLYSFHRLKQASRVIDVCYTQNSGLHKVYDVNCDAGEFCAGPFKVKNCDDFSDALHGQYTFDTYPKGYAHGELWVMLGNGGGHAINCWLIQEKDGALKMVVVEPQSGKIFDFPSNWNAFMIKI